jgi:hypothetical protein
MWVRVIDRPAIDITDDDGRRLVEGLRLSAAAVGSDVEREAARAVAHVLEGALGDSAQVAIVGEELGLEAMRAVLEDTIERDGVDVDADLLDLFDDVRQKLGH